MACKALKFSLWGTLALCVGMGACGEIPEPDEPNSLSPSSAAAPADNAARPSAPTIAEVEPEALSDADQARVCRAAIADMNGHPPSIVRVISQREGIARLRYRRPADGKAWTNECRVDGDRVIWRTVDAFGPGSGLGRWRTHAADETVQFSIDGSRVTITTTFPGEPPSAATYTMQ